jgi:hypothetical protein
MFKFFVLKETVYEWNGRGEGMSPLLFGRLVTWVGSILRHYGLPSK